MAASFANETAHPGEGDHRSSAFAMGKGQKGCEPMQRLTKQRAQTFENQHMMKRQKLEETSVQEADTPATKGSMVSTKATEADDVALPIYLWDRPITKKIQHVEKEPLERVTRALSVI